MDLSCRDAISATGTENGRKNRSGPGIGPSIVKDERYWERRKKNNISARKSRNKSKELDSYARNRVIVLENANALLRMELVKIKKKYGLPLDQTMLSESDIEECSRQVANGKSAELLNQKTNTSPNSKGDERLVNDSLSMMNKDAYIEYSSSIIEEKHAQKTSKGRTKVNTSLNNSKEIIQLPASSQTSELKILAPTSLNFYQERLGVATSLNHTEQRTHLPTSLSPTSLRTAKPQLSISHTECIRGNTETHTVKQEDAISPRKRGVNELNNIYTWKTEKLIQEPKAMDSEPLQYHYLLDTDDYRTADSDISPRSKKIKVENEVEHVHTVLDSDDEAEETCLRQDDVGLKTTVNGSSSAKEEPLVPKGFEDACTVWDMTRDGDKEDIKYKLQKITDQLEVMQRLVVKGNNGSYV